MLAPQFVVNEASGVTRNSAVISGTVTPVGNGVVQNCGVVYSTDVSLTGGKQVLAASSGNIEVSLTGLLPNTTYYYGLFAFSGFNTAYSQEVRSFVTLDLAKPTLGEIKLVQASIADLKLSCPITDDGGQTFSKVGFKYRVAGTEEWKEVVGIIENGAILAVISDLDPNTKYEVYAFVEYGTDGKVENTTGSHVNLTTSNTMAQISNMGDGGDL